MYYRVPLMKLDRGNYEDCVFTITVIRVVTS